MSKILIFGNIIKDVYLKLEGRPTDFERDEHGIGWMNLAFGGSINTFFHRTSVFGGATVTLEVLKKFGLDAKIAGVEPGRLVATEHRYILCSHEQVAYFVPDKRAKTSFEEPTKDTQVLLVDRSANLSETLVRNLLTALDNNKKLLLIMYAPKQIGVHERQLLERANLIFADQPEDLKMLKNRHICYLQPDKVQFGQLKQSWNLKRADLKTHLTLFSVASASILGGILQKRGAKTALLLAKANVENSSLSSTLPLNKLEEIIEDEQKGEADLKLVAKSLVAYPKGILAADESGGSIHKKFLAENIPDDEKHRRDYRNLFFTTPNLDKYVNGVILFDETARQSADNGQNFVDFLTAKGIIPGIKVDQGLENFPNSPEKYTKGLDGLRDRLHVYYQMGMRFAKWRAAFEISDSTPSDAAIFKNCEILARYAADCQAENIVPIVEPEVVYDGNFSLETCEQVTTRVLNQLFSSLKEHKIDLGATILKVNMVLAGKQFPVQSTPEEVGSATARVLSMCVPHELAGVVFLSGGQTMEQATANLAAITKNGPFPWPVTFSFARALQDAALFAWKGDNKNADKARTAFAARLAANTSALKRD